MNILVIGKGCCEHAIAWKLQQSSNVECVYVAPGNAGTALDSVNIPISECDVNAISHFVQNKNIGLVVINSLTSLSQGLADTLESQGILVFGPSKMAALLESSKIFCKSVLTRASIPTAKYKAFDDRAAANKWIGQNMNAPVVIKANGFTNGKGVFLCKDYQTARNVIFQLMHKHEFGFAADQIMIEEYLSGEKVFVTAIVDGERFKILHIDMNDQNTYHIDDAKVLSEFEGTNLNGDFQMEFGKKIMLPVLKTLKSFQSSFKGILGVDLIMTSSGPYVMGFKVRFNDSKCQSLLIRMKTDFTELLLAAVQGQLDQYPPILFDEKKAFRAVLQFVCHAK
ncbi:MAG: ATP-grasp domain-containing protein [Planctomycetia bacterium]|nr:ATP-grasp domain-containing protein [Planctomycetia bacterium]